MALDWRNSSEYDNWREEVLGENPQCDVCEETESLHVHHMNHATYFPEERFDPDNGVVLCSRCHSNYHNNYHRSYRHKCTKYDYLNFKSLSFYLLGLGNKEMGRKICNLIHG